MAFFYRDMGQHEKSAQTWERGKDFSANALWQADWRLEAAQSYADLGDHDKENEMLRQAALLGQTDESDGALSLYGERLLRQSRWQEVEELLQQTPPGASTQRQLVTQLLRCSLLYQRAQWAVFGEEAPKALRLFEALTTKKQRVALAPQILQLEEQLKWAAWWPAQPLVAETGALTLRLPADRETSVVRRLFVSAHQPIALHAFWRGDSAPKDVTLRILPSPYASGLAPVRWHGLVEIEIAPMLIQAQLELHLCDTHAPAQGLIVPVSIQPTP